jgi:hypothetical protein
MLDSFSASVSNIFNLPSDPLNPNHEYLVDVFESAVQSPAGSLHRTTSPTSSTTTSTSAEGSSSQPRVVDQWSDQTSNSFSSLIFDASENNNSADAVAPNHLASEHQQLQAEQQSVATAVEQQIGGGVFSKKGTKCPVHVFQKSKKRC